MRVLSNPIYAATVSAVGTGMANEDRAIVSDNWWLVLDGAGPYRDVPYGCVHQVAWLVDTLARRLASGLDAGGDSGLVEILRSAITATRADHAATCDVDDPFALGSTVAITRVRGYELEWLVLGDSPAVIQHVDGSVVSVVDDRVDRLDGPVREGPVRTYDPKFVATVRNQPGGFWIAGSRPEAASHAYTGQTTWDAVTRFLLCTDGVSRLVDRYGWTWRNVLDVAATDPDTVIEAVRAAEDVDPNPSRRGKLHDDATLIYVQRAI